VTAKEFEEYVGEVVKHLRITDNARIYRNRVYEGKSQPGHYEVDVSLEFTVQEALNVLVIVECKNWQRPVDRPVIQKVAQTRTAIPAHKAPSCLPWASQGRRLT